jgi:hypothetical protein
VSFRLFSKEQISDGTTISLRLERVLGDFAARWNNVPKRDLRRRWFPDYTVGGFTPGRPGSATTNDRLPFCKSYNADADVIAAGGVPDLLIRNRWRAKGHGVPAIAEDAGIGHQYIWSTTFKYSRPVRGISLAVWLTTDAVFTNTFLFGSSPPTGKISGHVVDDFAIVLEVDDPYLPENRKSTSQIFLRQGVSLRGWEFDNEALVTADSGTHTIPAWTGTVPGGLMFVAQDLNIPIPAESRLRLSLVLPDYSDANASDWRVVPTDWPWDRQIIGWNLGIAEGVA